VGERPHGRRVPLWDAGDQPERLLPAGAPVRLGHRPRRAAARDPGAAHDRIPRFILALSEDLPIVIEAVDEADDEADRIRAVLPALEPMIGGGLVTLPRVEVVAYRAKDGGA
jgi:hypothetical protein